jgi:CDP-diacylglycerol--serine O-phosphatidyltransferase
MLRLADADRSLEAFALVLPFLMLLIGLLMISSIRYPSGKKVDLQTRTKLRNFVALLGLLGLVVLFREVAALCAFLAYIAYGLIRHWRRPKPPSKV